MCRVQYKCGNVFGDKRQEAMKSGKTYICYFGASGHGRCLVDTMSSFGVKGPLRKEIINFDFYYSSAAKLVALFQKKKMGERMHYSEITEGTYYSQAKPTTLPLPGNTKMHCIVFHPDGRVEMSRDICECDQCFDGNLSKCTLGNDYISYPKTASKRSAKESDVKSDNDDEVETDEESVTDEPEDDEDRNVLLNTLADDLIGNVIALRCDRDIPDSFYLCLVNKSCVAQENKYDSYNHKILKGEKYLHCIYLKKGKEHHSYMWVGRYLFAIKK